MNVNIKQAVADAQQAVLPWDLKLDLGDGVTRPVRPLLVADLAALQRLGAMSDDEGFDLLEGLFEPPGPGLRSMAAAGTIGAIELVAMATAVATYFQKKTEAVATQVGRTVASQMDQQATR